MADAICMGELPIRLVPLATGTNLPPVPAFGKASGDTPAKVAMDFAPPGDKNFHMGQAGENGFDVLEARNALTALVEAKSIPLVQESVQ